MKYLDGKRSRRDIKKMFSNFSGMKISEIEKMGKEDINEIINKIAANIRERIVNRKLDLAPIRYHIIIDGMSHKKREIGVENPLHQILDYVAVEGMKQMLDAKIGVFQCASIPGRGQSYGKKYIEKWIRQDNVNYFTKGDVVKCFPSIPIEKLTDLLGRDIKNETVNWLACELLGMFKNGLSIGSYLSQYLCNYYLSYAYHYASEKLFKVRNSKKKGRTRVRLIKHVLFYMDDFILMGSSKKDLRSGMKMLVEYIEDFLGLEVKKNWKINKIDCEPIDMLGFVFRRERTTIRTRIFLKSRRRINKTRKLIKTGQAVPLEMAYKCISAYGWYKNTNSRKVMEKMEMGKVMEECKRVVSVHAKKERGKIG